MTMTATDEVDRYVADVAVHLRRAAGLGDDERAELLDDLQQHLREVAAEPGPPLHERLGRPEDYAAELLGSAGVEPGDGHEPHVPMIRRAAQFVAHLQRTPVAERAVAYTRDLRPAWWLARGYLWTWAAFVVLDADSLALNGVFVPESTGSNIGLSVLAVVAGVAGSLSLARRVTSGTRKWRRLAVAGNVVAIVGFFAFLDHASAGSRTVYYYPSEPMQSRCLSHKDGRPIQNLYPYDSEGRPLENVLLYDDLGRPIDNLCPEQHDAQGNLVKTEYARDANGAPAINVFPRRQSRSQYDGTSLGPVPPPALVIPRLASPTSTTTTPAGATTPTSSATPTTTTTP
jgi:hypothetical protein